MMLCVFKSAGLEERALDGIVMITGPISNSGTLRCVCNFHFISSSFLVVICELRCSILIFVWLRPFFQYLKSFCMGFMLYA